jgi:dTDP-4-amino-4,6-dideoxygalactose transaminase
LKEIFKRIVERGGFILGEEIASFESEFAAYHNAKYCISEANVHEALLISLKAIDVGKGDEGVVSSTCRQLGWR